MKVTIIGGGSWGTALGHLLAVSGNDVTLLVRSAQQADEVTTKHTNCRYLPGLTLSPSLQATCQPETCLPAASVCVLAVPSQHMAEKLRSLREFVSPTVIPVCASKGVELTTLRRMQEVVAEEWPAQAEQYAILSGPSFAKEVIEQYPTAVVLGTQHERNAGLLQNLFSNDFFRVYASRDVIGVELGGAVKNVVALAAGISDGLGFGHNSRAAIITRGLAEMTRLAVALGGDALTLMGLSGMGDLVLTCTGDLSRNRQVGLMIGKGQSLHDITTNMHTVAEGLVTAEAVCRLAEQHGVDLPIAQTVRAIINGTISAKSAVQSLMTRDLCNEISS